MALILVIHNVSKLAPVSEYNYQVMVGDGGPLSHILKSGMVTHTRAEGWEVLVNKVLADGGKK